MHQYQFSLVFFTVLTQWAIGSVLSISLYRLLTGGATLKHSRETAIALMAICVVGSTSSLAHLGSPLQAYNALRGLGHAWLSREVVAFGAINGLMGLWMLTHVIKGKENLQLPLGLLTGVLGLASVTMAGQIYYVVEHQPSWHTVLTHLTFVGTALMLGLATLMVVLRLSGQTVPAGFRYLQGASVLLIFGIIVQLSQITGLDADGGLIFFRLFASVLVGVCLFMMAGAIMKRSTGMVAAATLVMVTGEIAGRMAFYSSVLGATPW